MNKLHIQYSEDSAKAVQLMRNLSLFLFVRSLVLLGFLVLFESPVSICVS